MATDTISVKHADAAHTGHPVHAKDKDHLATLQQKLVTAQEELILYGKHNKTTAGTLTHTEEVVISQAGRTIKATFEWGGLNDADKAAVINAFQKAC